jgi:hypothetical protein
LYINLNLGAVQKFRNVWDHLWVDPASDRAGDAGVVAPDVSESIVKSGPKHYLGPTFCELSLRLGLVEKNNQNEAYLNTLNDWLYKVVGRDFYLVPGGVVRIDCQ